MKNRKMGKVILLVLLIAILTYLTFELVYMTDNAYGSWLVNRRNVQERLYEAIIMLAAYLQLLIFSASMLLLSIHALVRTIRSPQSTGWVTLFIRKHGLHLAITLGVIFLFLFLMDRAALERIANTVETSEVPAALSDHILRAKLEIGAELAAEGAVISLISWMRNRKRKKILEEKGSEHFSYYTEELVSDT